MPISNSGARVVDVILSEISQGYTNAEFVGNRLFPVVPVNVSGGKIIEFNKDSFKLYSLRRAPGASTKEVEFGYLGKPYTLVQDSAKVKVPFEHLRDAAVGAGLDLGAESVQTGMDVITLALEYEQAQLATNAANYATSNKVALTGAAKWSATGNPIADIETAKEAIRQQCAVRPNVMVMSPQAFKACKTNSNVLSQLAFAANKDINAAQITPLMLGGLFGMDVVVGDAIYVDDAGNTQDIWGNAVVLAYVAPVVGNRPTRRRPSYGYTYVMEGHPLVLQPYYDNDKQSWMYPVSYERAPVLSGISSGYLISTPA